MMGFVKFIPVIREIVDLGFHIADNVRKRKAKRAAAKRKAPPC
jgi:UPF0716 family protein affecting phage T7 exclusion